MSKRRALQGSSVPTGHAHCRIVGKENLEVRHSTKPYSKPLINKLITVVIVTFTIGLFGAAVYAQKGGSGGTGSAGLNKKMSSETAPGQTDWPHANATPGTIQRFSNPPLRPKPRHADASNTSSLSVRNPANPSGRKDPNWRWPNESPNNSH